MPGQTDRILTTHAGSLPRPDELADMIWSRMEGQEIDEATLEARIDAAVAEVIDRQRSAGIDNVSDGEMSKTGFSTYVNERFSGAEIALGRSRARLLGAVSLPTRSCELAFWER